MTAKYDSLFQPVAIGNVTIPNRFFMAPMGPIGLSDAQGAFLDRAIDYYAERARGGTGLIITGIAKVEAEIEKFFFPSIPVVTHNPAAFMLTGKQMTERVHRKC